MNALALRTLHGHFVFFEAEIGDALLVFTNKKVVGEMDFNANDVGFDSFQPAKDITSRTQATRIWSLS